MNFFGIALRNPDKASLIVAIFTGGIMVAIIYCLTAFGMFSGFFGAMLAASSIGGALASAYGASIKTYGLRGALVSTAISGLFMATMYFFILVFN